MTHAEFRALRGPLSVLFEDEEELRNASPNQLQIVNIADVVGVYRTPGDIRLVKWRHGEVPS